MKKSVLLFASVLATAAFAQQQPAPAPTNGAQFPYQYAAKIVCGRPTITPTYPYQVAARGLYYTQVNVHNPSRNQGVVMRKKFINALPDERPTKPTGFFNLGLEPDWATQIDCHNIWKHLPTWPATPYVDGFVIIESTLELDVVGVYTAEAPTGFVSTIDIERVPVRKP